ncbi:MAG TPA: IS1182 family transposase [Anaerolineaceae bacterium]|nr:IS1182 family transposase [Anaerolineaceae bacterium]
MLRQQGIPAIPEETRTVAQAAFPNGNIYLQMRDEFGSIYENDVFADLYPVDGQPAIAPWRLALVTIMQYVENLSDRQTAEAVRGNIAWKYALSLPLTDAGFDFSVLSEFRQRLVQHEAGERLLNAVLVELKGKGLLKARGQQRTDATHVLAAVRELSRVENVGETLRQALNELAVLAPDWLRAQVTAEWFDRYGVRMEYQRLPKGLQERQALGERIGQDGYHLLEVYYQARAQGQVPISEAVEILRRVWVQQFWCDAGRVRQREVDHMPPVADWIRSPFDLEARYAKKRETEWVGYKVHLTETCDTQTPRLITHVATTPAPESDSAALSLIWHDLAALDLLPAQHLVDAGYVEGPVLVAGPAHYNLDVIGPAPQDQSWQARSEDGIILAHFVIDWEAHTVTCPTGQVSQGWYPSHSASGHPTISVNFAARSCRACPLKPRCTKGPARFLTLRPRPLHDALQAARQRETTDDFKTTYRARAGIEGSISQAVRVNGLRQTRYIGLAKTHLQNLASAAALNVLRAMAWLNEVPVAPTRQSTFARLAA